MKQQENRAEPQEKQIRFIDSHYNLKFYIPDGGKISPESPDFVPINTSPNKFEQLPDIYTP